MALVDPQEFLSGNMVGWAVFERVRDELQSLGPIEVRTTKSQIAFWRRRGFAYLWQPSQYLKGHTSPVVLSIDLPRHDRSVRFKEVARPSTRHWMHHLEIDRVEAIDDEVVAWLREAAASAS